MRSASMPLSLIWRWLDIYLKVSSGLPWNVIRDPRNLCGSLSIVPMGFSLWLKVVGLALPEDREKDLHLDDFSLSCTNLVHIDISLISLWRVRRLVVHRLKSAANGVHIIRFLALRVHPLSLYEFSYYIMGLKAITNIIGLRGSIWNTPFWKILKTHMLVTLLTYAAKMAYLQHAINHVSKKYYAKYIVCCNILKHTLRSIP